MAKQIIAIIDTVAPSMIGYVNVAHNNKLADFGCFDGTKLLNNMPATWHKMKGAT
jgi:hypothetical protein